MPVVSVGRDALFSAIGENYGTKPNVQDDEADDKFQQLCFEFGVELDDVTSEKAMVLKELKDAERASNLSEEIVYKIAIPANRYDLLCLEGIARALRIFMLKEKPPAYKLSAAGKGQKQVMQVDSASVGEVRPIVVCAVLRDVTFTEATYRSFIDLQEKLHQNICRHRTLASIGTHDLDTLKGPFRYVALPPKEFKFAPLNLTKVMTGEEVVAFLDNDQHLKKYLDLIRHKPRYPVILDAENRVLSLPPIINGDHSKISLKTKNVFIEVTATDFTKANIVLNTVVAMFSQYCRDPFTIEPVDIVPSVGGKSETPDLTARQLEMSVDYLRNGVGIAYDKSVTDEKVATLLTRMALQSELLPAESGQPRRLRTTVPITRSDVLHAVDVVEDLGIAYGYNNIRREVPQTLTEGHQQPINQLSDAVRLEVALQGFDEVLTFTLCSEQENYEFLRKADDGLAVKLGNPQTVEFQVARTSLLPGILKTARENRMMALPLKLFEVSDIVLIDPTVDVGAANRRQLCALYGGTTAGFEVIHALLDRVMQGLRVDWHLLDHRKLVTDTERQKNKNTFSLSANNDPTFLAGRAADVLVNGRKTGVMGVLHPAVLQNFGIPFPCSVLEISLETFA